MPHFDVGIGDPAEHRFFCAGSCFARNLEHALSTRGVDVATAGAGLDMAQNKYSAQSLLNEFRWAIRGEAGFAESQASILPAGDGTFQDLQGNNIRTASGEWAHGSPDRDEVVAWRRKIFDTFRNFAECDVFVFTLGLAEAWHDNETALYLNHTPPAKTTRDFPGRFELHVLSYQDIVDALGEVYAIIEKARAGRPFQILLSVSPVRMHATLTDDDVLVANTYSKSVQRAAASEFVIRHANATYIPSFEMATLSDPRLVWQDDLIHVRPAFVSLIIETVLARMRPSGGNEAALLAQAGLIFKTAHGHSAKADETWKKVEAILRERNEFETLLHYYKRKAGD
jgi:hypothetical protein